MEWLVLKRADDELCGLGLLMGVVCCASICCSSSIAKELVRKRIAMPKCGLKDGTKKVCTFIYIYIHLCITDGY